MIKKILVTGGSGFIGSHLVEELIKKRYKIEVLAPYNIESSIGWLKDVRMGNQVKITYGDVCDQSLVFKLAKRNDAIIHLAALISIPYSYQSPSSYVNTNIIGTLNLLEACRKFNIKKFLHTSTSEVYGSAEYTPIDEKNILLKLNLHMLQRK